MEKGYDVIADVWDELNSEVDYSALATHADSLIRRYKTCAENSVVDLGCGTGSMTLPLAERGYDMIGVDISDEMLSTARDRAAETGREAGEILWLCQDMSDFELYGTVGAAVCCLDGINHLTDPAKVRRCFSLAHNYIEPGGVFIFDVNTPRKFREVYGGRDYILESDGVTCMWQNDYNEKTGLCRFGISVFEERSDGAWDRRDSDWSERCYSRRRLEKWLADAGFEVISVTDGYSDTPATEDNMRWLFCCRRI